MNAPFWLKNLLKYGLLLGLLLCLYTVLMWLTRLDTTYLAVGQYLDVAISLLPISLLVLAIRQQLRHGQLRVLPRVGVGVGVGVVAELVYRPFLALYHAYLNPSWFSYVLALRRTELLAAGQQAAGVAAEVARLQAVQARQAGVFSGFWLSALALPALVALLTLPFLRNQPAGRGSTTG